MDEKTQKEIKGQIEYYLSDSNLEGDEFFHNLISKDTNGFLDLEYIMQCNKIKKAGWTKEQIINSLKDSDKIELNSDKTKIRRKDNKPLPPLDEKKLLSKKRIREKKGDQLSPTILIVSSDKDTEMKWQNIESKYKSLNPTLSVIYTRFKTNEGHFGVFPMGANAKEGQKEINFVKEFEIEGIKFKVSLCEGKDLDKFMEENKSHLDLCVNKERNKKIQKKNKTSLEVPIKLGNEEFSDIAKIKEKIRKMMSQVQDELIILDEEQTKFMKDLVKFHPEKDVCEKLKDVPFIGVGKIDPHKYTKAFFGLNDNKDKIFEFLVHKCPEKILIDDRKKNKEKEKNK
jgi:hypothetical protein